MISPIHLPLLLVAAVAGQAIAQQSLEQERDRIGEELTQSREQTDRDINRIREDALDRTNRLDDGARSTLPGQPGQLGRGSGSTVRQPDRPVAPATRSEPGRPLTTPQPRPAGDGTTIPGTPDAGTGMPSGNGGAASGAGGASTGGAMGGGADR